jgi:general secretion pathway protein K
MKRRPRPTRLRKRGIALIMVLGALTILTMMLAEFQSDTSATLASAMADRDGVQAEYVARSAVNLSRLLIAMEPTIRQAISPLFAFMKRQPPQLPIWEFSDKLLAPFNDKASTDQFATSLKVNFGTGKNLGLPVGRFELAIMDEDAKINVNLGASNDIAHIRLAKELMGLMAPPQYNPLFEQRDTAGNYHDRLATCAAIIDWADVDEAQMNCDTTTGAPASSGVEDAYYQLLAVKPYRRKNAPYDSLEELHLVRGVTDDYWATFVDPDPTNPKKRVMTVWGQGAINVNSANAQTLLGVVCSAAKPGTAICTDPTQAGMFLTGVTMARAMSMGAPLFGAPSDFIDTMKGKPPLGTILQGMGMKPVEFLSVAEFTKTITTESKVFSINAIGVIKGYKRETRLRITTVVDFRKTPNLTSVAAPTSSGGTQGTLPTGGSQQQMVMPATAGNVVYFRID